MVQTCNATMLLLESFLVLVDYMGQEVYLQVVRSGRATTFQTGPPLHTTLTT
jgi:hypothetical protein